MTRAREQEGFALISAIIISVILIGLGLALLGFTDQQQTAAGRQQNRESAYALAEAALNAQVFQLGVQWPTSINAPYPTSCSNSSNGTSYCPAPSSVAGSFGAAYPQGNTASCPAGTQGDAWASSGQQLSNQWTTYVRSDANTGKLYNSSTDQSNSAYDSGNDGGVWVRAVGIADCRTVTLITHVSVQYTQLTFPQNAIYANGFSTSNNGNKVIVNTQGSAPQAGAVTVHCSPPLSPPAGPGTSCTNYRSGQVSPDDTSTGGSASAAPLLNSYQLASLKSQAQTNGTYWPSGSCPSSISQLTGQPVYIEGPCTITLTGNGTANSASSPGFLVLLNGTIEFNGTVTYYGVVYAANQQGSTGTVVTAHGNATVQGAIDVDGAGTIDFGSSSFNFIYDPTAFSQLKSWGGAEPTPNTFRELPDNQ